MFKYMNTQGGRLSTPSIQNDYFFWPNVLLNQTSKIYINYTVCGAVPSLKI